MAYLAEVNYLSDRLQIIVVDSGCIDGTAQAVRQSCSFLATVLPAGESLGYAGGNNVGVRDALAKGIDCICILDNDTQGAPGSLATLLPALFGNAQVGVTPLIAEMDEPEKAWALGQTPASRTGIVARALACEHLQSLEARARRAGHRRWHPDVGHTTCL